MKRLILILLFLPLPLLGQDIYGEWTLIPGAGTDIDLYGTVAVGIQDQGEFVTLTRQFGTRRSFRDSVRLPTNGAVTRVPVVDRVFPTNVFMGLQMPVGDSRTLRAKWIEAGRSLKVEESFEIMGSQGRSPMKSTHHFTLAENGETMTYTIQRSTRKKAPGISYRMKRKGYHEAWYMALEDDWKIDSRLHEQAFLISLQGLANVDGPNLYYIFPETWDFNYTQAVFDFYKSDRFYTFRKLRDWKHAFRVFRDKVKGYVVWDKNVRTSLIVAYTVAGLERAVVISEEMIPAMEEAGLEPVEDFRGRFTGMNDYEIYSWAYDQYWARCSKDLIIWLGGHHGNVMKPGIADWGMRQKAFFQDLSTKESDEAEFALANKLLSELNPLSMVMGWHSYKKDKERDHVRLTSSYGHRVKGLHTLPNTSFSAQVTTTPGFEYRNNHNVVPGRKYRVEDKVYITCVQTDGVGLGAWTKQGRGEIPYAWVLGVNDLWMAPAMLEFFYSQATPNDYFIGGTTPGYMYPKMIPDALRPELMGMTAKMLDSLDLVITQTMDYSEGATVEGNTELTRSVVDAFFKYLPNVKGFLNGYAPAYTFTTKNKIPVISYDYYLSPSRPVDDAVADLEELAAINSVRPYFLVAHIRQWSDIRRVKTILDGLGPEFELLPLDIFMKMAGEKPTYEERFLER